MFMGIELRSKMYMQQTIQNTIDNMLEIYNLINEYIFKIQC